ncbi:disease resistance RPP13-like protein 4 [Lolium perenne]|uniref:disease resistance RPP13-like protein 4 n=1 Tax=Lolium perenne TaxID=4522 RepID=UPI003A997425
MEDILKRVSKWESDIINDFGGIARHLEDIIEEDSQQQFVLSKLQIVNTEMSYLKDRMKFPLHVPLVKPAAPAVLSPSLPFKFLSANASEQWKKLEIERKILESSALSDLQLSYYNLDLQLKLCLLCFSIFPENSIISKRAMIYWWIGEGLVEATRSQTAEDIGKDCFQRLINAEMIELSSKQLKYLCLRGISRITELPSSIGALPNLRILDLHACHNLERLSESITSLQMLTHLDVSECYLLEGMPRGIGLLTELQVLKGFVIGGSTGNYNCRVAELVRLDKLKKLSIYIGSKVVVTEDELNEVANIKALRVLTITWAVLLSKKGVSQQDSAATALLTSLSLPPHLEKLDLRCFPGENMPVWLSPSRLLRLQRLYFTGGMLQTFGDKSMSELWNIEILRLKFLNYLVLEWTQVHEMFPNLTFLEVFRCTNIKSFPCDKDGVWMNCDTHETIE